MAGESLHLFALRHIYTLRRLLGAHAESVVPSQASSTLMFGSTFLPFASSHVHCLRLSSNPLMPSRMIFVAHRTTDEPSGRTRHQGVFAMRIGHRGMMATVERDKRRSDRGRDQGMKELAVTSDVDWIICICTSPLVPSSSSTTVFDIL